MSTQSISLESYPLRSFEKLRYGDTDRQGHVNNAVFSTFLETGRVGSSSLSLSQAVFQNGVCVAKAKTTIVQVNNQTRRSQPLSEEALSHLSASGLSV